MTDEEQAKEIRQKLAAALLVVNGIIETAHRKKFNVSYKSDLNQSTGKFETKIEISKRM